MTKDKYDTIYKKGTEIREILKDTSLHDFLTIICVTIDDWCENHNRSVKDVAKTICVAIHEKGDKE